MVEIHSLTEGFTPGKDANGYAVAIRCIPFAVDGWRREDTGAVVPDKDVFRTADDAKKWARRTLGAKDAG